MSSTGSTLDIETVHVLAQELSNWGRWGSDDQRGTLNLIGPEQVVTAAVLVKSGEVISMGILIHGKGPQTGDSVDSARSTS
jgi:hypothetical protein